MNLYGGKKVIGVFVFIFLFSQMNLPEKIVNKSTYDYVVNVSKFSFTKSDSINDDNVEKLISSYKLAYFDTKKVKKRLRNLSGKRIYKTVDVIVQRKKVNPLSLNFVKNQYNSIPSFSPYKSDISILYADVLSANGRYRDALNILYSLSNTSVYDESLLRIVGIFIEIGNYDMAKSFLLSYEDLKGKSIYSPVYIVYKSIITAKEGDILGSLRMMRNLVVYDLTQKYDYVDLIVSYFEKVFNKNLSIEGEYKDLIRDICYELVDYKFYEEALKIAYLGGGNDLVLEVALDLKLIGAKGWKKLANTYLNGYFEKIFNYPLSFEKSIYNYHGDVKNVILKSLFVYYLNVNQEKSAFYLEEFFKSSNYKNRVYFMASKLIEKLILKKDYSLISSLLNAEGDFKYNFLYKDIDRFYFFKGYAYEVLGKTNEAVNFYQKAIFSVPSGYYDYLASRRISEISLNKDIKSYYDRFISPNTPDTEKFNIAKLLFNFDKQNSDLYKSFVLYKTKDSNPFLMNIPYGIVESMDKIEKSKIKSMLERIKDEYVVVSKMIRNKMVYKGLSNVFSYVVIIRNRLEMKITRGIYNEGNNITANKFVDAYSKFLPFSIQEVLYPIPYVSDVIYSAERFGVDPNLVYAVIKQESFFQEEAYSRAGAIGLMQVLYSTGKLVARKLDMSEILLTRHDLFKTDVNIFLGTAYLSILIDSYGDLNHAISAYNGGPRVFLKTQKKYKLSLDDSIVFSEFLAFRETKQYIKRVVKYYNVYSSIYNFDVVKKDFDKNLEEIKSRLMYLQEKLKPSEKEIDDEE